MTLNNDVKKRYTITVLDGEGDKVTKLSNVSLKNFTSNLVIVVDSNGKEHIFTGGALGILLDEV